MITQKMVIIVSSFTEFRFLSVHFTFLCLEF